MLGWTAIFGAALGWLLAGFEGYGFIIGGFLGLAWGWGLRRSIRAEITATTEALLAKRDRQPSVVADPNFSVVPEDKLKDEPQPIVTVYRSESAEEPSFRQPPEVTPTLSFQTFEPEEPSKSSQAFSTAFNGARNWLLGGNTIVRVGLVVLFVGLSFLASYAAAAGLFPVEMRLALVAIVGAGLLATGFRARLQKPNFGLALQGGGVATIYLTLFAAVQLVEGFSPVAAFALMICVCALGCALALLQRSQALAVTAFTGGFAVPVLVSTGSQDLVGLFAYYTLLNFAILFIAQQRSWRVLNLIGFVSTFGLLTLLVASGVASKQIVAAQSFLIVSVLIYVAAGVFYTFNTPSPTGGRLGNIVDTTLLFGTALVGFGLQVGLVGDQPFGSAFAALAFGALYIAIAAFIARRQPDTSRVMMEAMLAIGIGFVTLAIPLALGAQWTSAAWALEGLGAFWIGMRQARWLPRLFGLALQIVAAFIYVAGMEPNITSMPLANSAFLGAMIVALAALTAAWWLRRDIMQNETRYGVMYASFEKQLAKPAFLAGFAFWWLAWVTEANRVLPSSQVDGPLIPSYGQDLNWLLIMLAYLASACGFQRLGRANQWQVAIWPSAASLVVLTLGFLQVVGNEGHVLYVPGCLIWIIAIALHLWMLYLNDHDSDGVISRTLLVGAHVGGVWLATAMLADCLSLAIDKGQLWNTSWAGVSFLASGVAVLLLLTLWATRKMTSGTSDFAWPLNRYCVAYGWNAVVPIAAIVALGSIVAALFASGAVDPLPYIPLVNPVDLMVALALVALELWRRNLIFDGLKPEAASRISGRAGLVTLGMLAFIVINSAWLRTAHQLLGVDWSAQALFDSTIVQTGLAILWTTLALPLMVMANRRADRKLWITGAGLLGLTVLKLLLVDLNNTGGGARIIAFIAVGVLMLVVGYLAPLPPQVKTPISPFKDEQPGEGTTL
jgi:uncharacterized membrane protein